MWIDLTVSVSRERAETAIANEKMTAFGHLGTHFDVMNLVFPLENAKRSGLFFNKAEEALSGQDIELEADELSLVERGDFVIFRTGAVETMAYGSQSYFGHHPQLSVPLIDVLIDRGVAMIGIDAAGIRRGPEHTPMDQYCADHGVFVVENLCNLDAVLKSKRLVRCDVYTFPVKFEGLSGLPCRVMAMV